MDAMLSWDMKLNMVQWRSVHPYKQRFIKHLKWICWRQRVHVCLELMNDSISRCKGHEGCLDDGRKTEDNWHWTWSSGHSLGGFRVRSSINLNYKWYFIRKKISQTRGIFFFLYTVISQIEVYIVYICVGIIQSSISSWYPWDPLLIVFFFKYSNGPIPTPEKQPPSTVDQPRHGHDLSTQPSIWQAVRDMLPRQQKGIKVQDAQREVENGGAGMEKSHCLILPELSKQGSI